jgi:hypothetical protein
VHRTDVLRPLCAGLALALAAACAPGEAAETAAAVAEPTLNVAGWSLREQARVGGPQADEATALFTVAAVAEDADGQFYVSNFGDKRVLVFDSTGAHLRTIGRGGKGPGEFSAPRAVAALGDDVFVLDMGPSRISRFRRADGTHLGDVTLPRNLGVPVDMRAAPDGRVAVEYRGSPLAPVQSPPVVVPVDPRTGVLDMAAAVRMDTVPRVQVKEEKGKRRSLRTLDLPFAPRPVWDLQPGGGLAFGNGAEFVVRRAVGGAISELFRGEGRALPVTRDDRERFFEEPARKSLRDKIRFPETKPFFTGLRVDDAGNLWVNVPSAGEGERWEVRDPSGRTRGELRLPPGARLLYLGRGSAYVVQKDENDVETVVRFALVR